MRSASTKRENTGDRRTENEVRFMIGVLKRLRRRIRTTGVLKNRLKSRSIETIEGILKEEVRLISTTYIVPASRSVSKRTKRLQQ